MVSPEVVRLREHCGQQERQESPTRCPSQCMSGSCTLVIPAISTSIIPRSMLLEILFLLEVATATLRTSCAFTAL
jgi:hypothetical protein